jgi:hypothetical protein
MNVPEAIARFMQDELSLGTLQQDIWVGQAPSSKKAVDDLWWIIASGGDKEIDLVTGGSLKNYILSIYRRSKDYKALYNTMQTLEETFNCAACVTLPGFEVMQIEASNFPIDNDLDREDRKLGLLQINLRVYKDC